MKSITAALAFALVGAAGLPVAAAELTWHTDMAKALDLAKAEKKQVLLNITGSDWCGFCIKLDQEVFKSAQFADYAAKNLVLVKADFPRRTKLPAAQQEANEAMKAQYAPKFEGFPTVVLIDANGKKLGQTVGYSPGSGPKAFLAELDKAQKK